MKKILIVGAGFLQDFVIRKAVSMGYETLTIDADPDAIGFSHAHKHAVIDIVNEEACLEYAKKEHIDGVLTVATDFGVLTASFIAEQMGLPGLKYSVAKTVKNKYLVRKCLFENNVDDTQQCYLIANNYDISLLKDKLTYPVIVKPCDGSGSRGTNRVDNANGLIGACKSAIDNSLSHQAIVESFIEGDEYGAESIVVNGEVYVLGIMRKRMTNPPYYAELGHAMPCGLSDYLLKKTITYVSSAIKALGIDFGSVNMDLLITNNGSVHIVDVGARMGGNMIGTCVIPYGTGIDYVAAIINNALGEPVELNPSNHYAVATRILAFDKGVVARMPDVNSIERRYGVEVFHHMTEGMLVNQYRTNLDGCGYIVAKSDSLQEAEKMVSSALIEIIDEAF